MIHMIAGSHRGATPMQRVKGVALLLVIAFVVYLIVKLILKMRRCCRSSPEAEFDISPPPANVRCWKRIRLFPSGTFPPSPSTEPTPGFTESAGPPPALLPPGWTTAPAPSTRPPSYESAARTPGIPPFYWELMSSMANSSEANLERIVKSIKGEGSSSTLPPTRPTAPDATPPDMESVMRQMESASNPGNQPLPIFPQGPVNPEPIHPAPEDPVVSPSEPSTRDPVSHTAGTATNGGNPHRAIALTQTSGVPESLNRLRKLIAAQ